MWRITYKAIIYYFADAESAFRFHLQHVGKRDLKTMVIEKQNGEAWEIVA